jgi:hypothetical protein
MAETTLLCAICLYRGFTESAVTITGGYAVCKEHAKPVQERDHYLQTTWPRPAARPRRTSPAGANPGVPAPPAPPPPRQRRTLPGRPGTGTPAPPPSQPPRRFGR